MAKRIYNFNPGPSTLPLAVLETVQGELLDYRGTGMSEMELSHRSPEYDEINETAIALTRRLMGIGDDYQVLFMTGGASTQFALVPLNFMGGGCAAYVDTGTWSAKAIKEAGIVAHAHGGRVDVAASSKDAEYRRIPNLDEIEVPGDASYLHITTNNTIKGTQWHAIPEVSVPLVADMSSDILSRRWDFSKYACIYAGAQKNLGAAGVTLVAVRNDLMKRCPDGLPSMFDYRTHAGKKSLYNTPPSFNVYVLKLVLEWIDRQGGLEAIEALNRQKKDAIYDTIDANRDFYRGTVDRESRSWMNITLRLPSEDLEKRFIGEAKDAGFGGLKGHRSVGGVRVSLYNAMPVEGAEKLAAFMKAFRKMC